MQQKLTKQMIRQTRKTRGLGNYANSVLTRRMMVLRQADGQTRCGVNA